MLAFEYLYGERVPQNYKQAAYWYKMAASQDDTSSIVNLAEMYQAGQGVHQSYKIAYALFNLSISNGGSAKLRELIAEKMSRQEIAEGQELTERLLQPKMFSTALDAATRNSKK